MIGMIGTYVDGWICTERQEDPGTIEVFFFLSPQLLGLGKSLMTEKDLSKWKGGGNLAWGLVKKSNHSQMEKVTKVELCAT